MHTGRTIISSVLALSLAACGGGGGGGGGQPSGGAPTPTPTATPAPTALGCSLATRQQFVRDVLNEWYLFPELLATNVNPASFTDVQDYIDALVAPARAQSKDRFFTYITSIEEENALINSGSSAGFGVRFGYDTTADRVFVLEAFENAPGLAAGIDRGAELLTINGQSVAALMDAGGPQAVVDALGPSDPGVSRTLGFRDASGVQRSATVVKADFALDPISDRYGVRIIDNGGTRVGYINLRTFIVQDAGPQLRAAFQQLRDAGITQVVLDVRYNGGGLVSVAELLGDLMLAGNVGNVFSRTVLRPSKASENTTEIINAQPQAIQTTRVAVIGRGGTASASELIANSLIPYLDNNLALVGTNTFGKPVGQFAFDRAACDDRLRAVAFKTVNADNQGEYFTGLASVMPNTCLADDTFTFQLGDPREQSLERALGFLRGETCQPIAQTGQTGVQSVTGRMLLQPARPNAAQVNVPGLF